MPQQEQDSVIANIFPPGARVRIIDTLLDDDNTVGMVTGCEGGEHWYVAI
jgi:hypothetical protein